MMDDDYGAVQACFNEWDADDSGTIDRDELAEALVNIGMDIDDAQLSKMLKDVTGSDDRDIDYNSFVKWVFTNETPTSRCPTRGKVREAIGLAAGDEEEEEEDDYDYEEGDDEDDYDYEEGDDDEDEEDDEDEDVSPPASPVRRKKSPKAKSPKGKKSAEAQAKLQAELDRANHQIDQLKADLEKKAKQEAERKARHEQKEKERQAKAAEQERQEKLMAAAAGQQIAGQQNTTAPDAAAAEDSSPVAAAARPKAKRRPKRKEPQDFLEEGVVCTQEIQMGEKQQIRSALGVGDEVWTIDWGGMVSVRARHNAQYIKAQIPTSSFVTSMLHIQPSLMWLGQEQQGIKLIDSKKRADLGTLRGGHSSLISCLCVDDAMLGEEKPDGSFPVRRVWSGSDDFTIRQWFVYTWWKEATAPAGIPGDAVVVETEGRFKIAISKGLQLHGHKNKIRTMIKLGPNLWTGSDDGTIRIWNCADSLTKEIIPAHRDGVLQLVPVRSFVWSAGTDGNIREWSNHVPEGDGTVRRCVRSIAPEGFEKGVYGMLPLGQEVWTIGHDPNIQVFGQQSLDKTCNYQAHFPYVSKLIGVDRMVTKTVWSTSFADRKLKVWNHVIRDDTADTDALTAANKLYVQAERNHAKHIEDLAKKLNEAGAILHKMGLNDMNPEEAQRIAESIGKLLDGLKDLSPEEQAKLLDKVAGVINGLSHLGAEDMANALDKVGDLLKNLGGLPAEQMVEALDKLGQLVAGLDHLPPEKLVEALGHISNLVNHLSDKGMLDVLEHLPGLVDAFNDLGLKRLLKNPDALKRFLQAFVNQGMEHLIDDPEKMEAILKIFNDLDARGLLDGGELNAYMQKSRGGAAGGAGASGRDGDGDGDSSTAREGAHRSGLGGAGGPSGDGDGQLSRGAHGSGLGGAGYPSGDGDGQLSRGDHGSGLGGAAGRSAEPELKQVIAAGKGLVDLIAEYKDMLEAMGLGDLLNDPSQLRKLFETMQQLRAALEENGFGDFLRNPAGLAEFLSNYRKVKAAFDEFGLGDLIDDPYFAKGWLKNYKKIEDAFKEAGLDYLLHSAGAMKDFLNKHAAAGEALQGMGDLASRIGELEAELQQKDSALQRANAENQKLKSSLAAFEQLGTVDEIQRLKDENIILRNKSKNASATNARIRELEKELANKEQDRLDALEREKVMFSRYKELDIFKLDIIAREMKGVLKKVTFTEKQCKSLKDQANKLKDYADRRQVEGCGNEMVDQCRQTEAHIHDILAKCFSETQRRHIGIAGDNEYRADDRRDGRLLEGGTMVYEVQEQMEAAAWASLAHVRGEPVVERPDYGSSVAAPAYRDDTLKGIS